MARERTPEEVVLAEEKKRIKDEKKSLKRDQKMQRKEAKKRAKEIARRETELDDAEEGGGLATFLATILIVAVWLAVIVIIIKLDIGGFGSNVLTPVLKEVPVVNKILPGYSILETETGGSYDGYTSLKDAVDQIHLLEAELENAKLSTSSQKEEITNLQAEVKRLQEFEQKQVEFQRIKTEFFEEVVYAEKGPGSEEYKKYYEAMDPATAEYIYRQVIVQLEEDAKILEYASAYSQMKPKQAAGIFEEMDSDLELVARILNAMSADQRGAILGVMDAEIAAKLTKIMDPAS